MITCEGKGIGFESTSIYNGHWSELCDKNIIKIPVIAIIKFSQKL